MGKIKGILSTRNTIFQSKLLYLEELGKRDATENDDLDIF
jgi:hypothetical protein